MELHADDTDGTTTSESSSSPKRLAEMKIWCSKIAEKFLVDIDICCIQNEVHAYLHDNVSPTE